MPAQFFAERSAYERREKRTEIDADVEDRICAVTTLVAGRIKSTHLRRHIGLERTIAENEHGQGNEEQRLESHHEVAKRHHRRAEEDRAVLAEHAVGEHAAEHGRKIDETGIESVDLRSERLHPERPEYRFEQIFKRGQPDHILHMPGQQQQSYHVQDEQGAHAIIGEALPHFRREQESQSTRVTEEVARFFAAPVPLLSRRENHVTSLRYVSRY